MKTILSRRPSPAMVIALIALFVSLSGVSYGVATGFIDSREIQNNEVRTRDLRNNDVRGVDIRNSTVQGRDVAPNTVTGDDVREEALGKVPSAASADSAGTAGTAQTAGSASSADSVGGVTLREVAYAGEAGGGYVEVLNLGGLRVEVRCLNAGSPAMEVRAYPGAQNSEIFAQFPNFGGVEANDFDMELYLDDGTIDGLARIEYAGADGRTVSFQGFTDLESNGVRGTSNDCGLFGVAAAG